MRPRDQVVELRNYIMHPGQRDTLIGLFEQHFIEPQEALGANVLGTFRNLDDPDRFVWLRGFADMEARYAALDGFYTGEIWRAHRSAANVTMIDSDDVLLLRPLVGDLSRDPSTRQAADADAPNSLVVIETYFLSPHGDEDFARRFAQNLAPLLQDLGGAPLATFATEHSPNTYPRLPVRENETVFVTVTCFESIGAHQAHIAARGESAAWRGATAAVADALIAPTQTLRLQPTARSLLR